MPDVFFFRIDPVKVLIIVIYLKFATMYHTIDSLNTSWIQALASCDPVDGKVQCMPIGFMDFAGSRPGCDQLYDAKYGTRYLMMKNFGEQKFGK